VTAIGQEVSDMADTSLVMELVARWQELRAQGRTVSAEELCAQYPGLLDDLKRQLEALQSMENFLGTTGGSPELVLEENCPPFPEPASSLSTCPQTRPGPGPRPDGAPLHWEDEGGFDLRDYVLLEELGHGGMGKVYRSRDPGLRRDLALKVLQPEWQGNHQMEQRFVQEARIAGSLQHPGIVPVYNLGRLPDGRLYYTMKVVRGQTFAAILKQPGERTAERLAANVDVFEKVCETLAYAHSKKVIHRDLKPHNVMVGAFGEVQVMDWGLAKALPRDCVPADSNPPAPASSAFHVLRIEGAMPHSRAGDVFGTCAYMSPEQAGGLAESLDEGCDVFGLGAMLCEILTGQPPYTGPTDHVILGRAQRAELGPAWERLQSCGAEEELIALTKRCLTVERSGRPRNAGEVAEAVRAYLSGVQERLRAAERERVASEARATEALLRAEAEAAQAKEALLRARAEAAFRKAIALKPDLVEAYHNLALALREQNKPVEAEAAFRKAIDLKPDLPEAHYNLGLALLQQNKPVEAEAAFRKAIALQPDLPGPYNNLGIALADQKKLAEAEAAYGKAIALQPYDPKAYYGLGTVLAAQKQLVEAEAAYRKAIELKPYDPKPYHGLGTVLAAQKQLVEAEAAYRKAIELKPDFPLAYYNLGNALRDQKKLSAAEAAYRQADELLPNQPLILKNLRLTELLLQLERKLDVCLAGKDRPSNPLEATQLAGRAADRECYWTAVRFCSDAFNQDPKLVDNLQTQQRYNAACWAALAAAGKGKEAYRVAKQERAQLRQQALEWLLADLKAYSGLLDKEPKNRPSIQQRLAHWRQDDNLALLRAALLLTSCPKPNAKPGANCGPASMLSSNAPTRNSGTLVLPFARS
jgi:serine/threonine protein kinase/Tfp pilus assembly protein PilF